MADLTPLSFFYVFSYINSTYTKSEEPGGSFSMGKKKKKPTFYSILHQELKIFFFFKKTSGFANTSLFTGDIDYVDMPVEGSYWILAITCMYPTLPPPP